VAQRVNLESLNPFTLHTYVRTIQKEEAGAGRSHSRPRYVLHFWAIHCLTTTLSQSPERHVTNERLTRCSRFSVDVARCFASGANVPDQENRQGQAQPEMELPRGLPPQFASQVIQRVTGKG